MEKKTKTVNREKRKEKELNTIIYSGKKNP